jgi:hypothetical protein
MNKENFLKSKKSISDLLSENRWLIGLVFLGLSGFLFGVSVSLGIGLNPLASIAFGIIAALGVLAAGSLVTYLLIQTIALGIITAVVYVLFRVVSEVALPLEFVQIVYLVVLLLAPAVGLSSKVKSATNHLVISGPATLIASTAFAALVYLLRERMPSDAIYALSRLYYSEDNAGIIAGVSNAIKYGYSLQSANLGEFTAGLYLAAAGAITVFGTQDSQGLLPVLTHWNVTLLSLAWIPLASLSAFVLAGKKSATTQLVAVILVMSGILALLLWPFLSLGHTSTISSGLFAMVLIATTLNKNLLLRHPVLFSSAIISLAFIAGNIWFPLMPFAAATAALVFISLLQIQYKNGNKRVVVAIGALFLLVALILLPRILSLVSSSDSLIQLAGATRSATELLIVVWLGLLGAAVLKLSPKPNGFILSGSNLFFATLTLLLASNIFLVAKGMLSNAGSMGYGASKYLLTTIAFTIPVLWMVLIYSKRRKSLFGISAAGLAILFSIFIIQPDHQQLLSSGVISVGPVTPEQPHSGVFVALQEALDMNPTHVLCVSDTAQPSPEAEVQWDAYFCTRWGESLAGADFPEGWAWRTTMIKQLPEESLIVVRDAYAEKDVVLIRFAFENENGDEIPEASQTWWAEYVDDSWEVVVVQ